MSTWDPSQEQELVVQGRKAAYCAGTAADAASLGVVLYEMLTGRVPFQADTPLAVMRGHADKAPPPPRELNPRLSEAVQAMLLKSLAKERASRYARGAALADALEQAVRARDAEAARQAVPGPPAQAQAQAKAEKAPGKRMPGWVLLLGGVLAVAIVAVVLVLLLGGGPDAAETRTPEPTRVVAVEPTATDPTVPTAPPAQPSNTAVTAVQFPAPLPSLVTYQFRLAGPPAPDPNYQVCCYIFGTVRDAAGNGLEGVRVQASNEWAPPAIALTKGGAELGQYNIPVGRDQATWHIIIVDAAGTQVSSQVQIQWNPEVVNGFRIDWQRIY